MTSFARSFAAVAGVLAVLALVSGHVLSAVAIALTTTGLLVTSVESGRREAEHRAAFAQRLRAARLEPQAAVVVRRPLADLPGRLLPLWVDVDGEARCQLAPGAQDVVPVSAGPRSVVVRRPWSAGRPVQVVVPAGGLVTVAV